MKRKASKKTAIFCVVLTAVLLVSGGVGGYLYWNSLPSQQFAFFPSFTAEPSRPGGLVLDVLEVNRNEDGSGSLKYQLKNNWDTDDPFAHTLSYGDAGPWIDYYYQNEWYQVYPRADLEAQNGTGSDHHLEPEEEMVFTMDFSEKSLAVPGRYRLRVDNVGKSEFLVMDDGKIAIQSR
ncbi:unknown [Clostridium sp. CAG:1013]|nr:unknown [Clostridium sp. CAG:1013]